MNPEALTNPIRCAVIQLKGAPVLYYGRAALSGEWYISVEATPEQIATLAQEAHGEGQQTIWHPYGPLLFPLDWLAEGSTDPKLSNKHAALKRLLESFPPQSQS
jgi:hypothetical protein